MQEITATQQFDVGPIAATDRRGNPAAFEGAPQFTSSDEGVCVVEPHPNGDPTMALVKATGAGAAQITVTVDADLGEGVEPLEGILGVNVLPAKAVALAVPTSNVAEQAE